MNSRFKQNDLSRKRRNEFQTKTEAVTGADDRRQAGVNRHVEFDLKEIAGVEQNTSIKNHSALAKLGSAAFDYGR